MKKVLVFGTFDFFHIGHLNFLLQAKELGDTLVVAIAQDGTVAQLKGKAPVHTMEERKKLITHLDCVDEVVEADAEIGAFKILNKVSPDIVAVGYDQDQLEEYLWDHIYAYDLKIVVHKMPQHQGTHIKSSMADA